MLVCLVPILSLSKSTLGPSLASHLSDNSLSVKHYGFYENVYSYNVRNLDKSSICFFVFKVFDALSMGTTKIAIVFLYFRILEGRKSRIMLWATQVANFLVMSSFIIALGLSCRPIWAYWAYSCDVEGAICPDLWDVKGFYTGFNLALDIWIILVPLFIISRLQLDTKSKLGVMAMFCLGIW